MGGRERPVILVRLREKDILEQGRDWMERTRQQEYCLAVEVMDWYMDCEE